MTAYAVLEATGGAPVELYRFVVGTTVYTYTSADVAVTFNGETYTPGIVKRDQNTASAESTKLQLNVGLSITTDLAKLFVGGAVPTVATCSVYRFQRGANLAAGLGSDQIVTSFTGAVTAVARQGAEATMTLTPPQRTIQQAIPRFRHQILCNHALYDKGCTMVKASFQAAGTVATIDATGRFVTVTMGAAGQAPPYYTGGILDLGAFSSFIETHTATAGVTVTLTLLSPVPTMIVGSAIQLAAGCDRTYATCIAKFANGVNHMGFPFVVNTDPWVNGVTTSSNPGSL